MPGRKSIDIIFKSFWPEDCPYFILFIHIVILPIEDLKLGSAVLCTFWFRKILIKLEIHSQQKNSFMNEYNRNNTGKVNFSKYFDIQVTIMLSPEKRWNINSWNDQLESQLQPQIMFHITVVEPPGKISILLLKTPFSRNDYINVASVPSSAHLDISDG